MNTARPDTRTFSEIIAMARDHAHFPDAPCIVGRIMVDGAAPGWTDCREGDPRL